MKRFGIAALGLLAAWPTFGQLTYTGCDDLKASDFKKTEVWSKNAQDPAMVEPLQIGLHGVKGGDGKITHVDMFIVGRKGQVRYFNGAAKTISDMGTISVWASRQGGNNDNGLMGVAVAPDYDQSRLLYFWYSPPVANINERRILRLSRIKVNASNKLDMASEKILIEFRGAATDRYHSGGPMQFDKYGDLWVQVGNQSNDLDAGGSQFSKDSLTSDEWGSSNTANLRGGTLRIHPDNSEKGYSIPADNFGEYWAKEWDKQGKTALAAEYRDTKKVLPEIYIKGERSNYSIGVHPTDRWMAWGTVNYQSSHDEFNAAKTPVFAGFPYFHDNNTRIDMGWSTYYNWTQTASAPRNLSPLSSGVKDLPPAWPGAVNALASVAIGGAVYGFDKGLDSRTKFPPHFDNTFVGFDFDPNGANPMWVFKVNTATMKVSAQVRMDNLLFAGIGLKKPLQAIYGPEGHLYILNYDGFYTTGNPNVTKYEYTGACQVPVSVRADGMRTMEMDVAISLEGVTVNETGAHELSLYDMAGARLARLTGSRGAHYAFGRLKAELGLGKGLHIVKVRSPKGELIRQAYLP